MISKSHQRCTSHSWAAGTGIIEYQSRSAPAESEASQPVVGLSPAWNIKCYFYSVGLRWSRNRVMMVGSWEDISQIMWPELANTCPGHNRLNTTQATAGGWCHHASPDTQTSITQMTRNWKQLYIKQSDVKLSTFQHKPSTMGLEDSCWILMNVKCRLDCRLFTVYY